MPLGNRQLRCWLPCSANLTPVKQESSSFHPQPWSLRVPTVRAIASHHRGQGGLECLYHHLTTSPGPWQAEAWFSYELCQIPTCWAILGKCCPSLSTTPATYLNILSLTEVI